MASVEVIVTFEKDSSKCVWHLDDTLEHPYAYPWKFPFLCLLGCVPDYADFGLMDLSSYTLD